MTRTIDRYEIKSELGRGGMATVYLARDPRFQRDVAVKVLPRQFTHDPRFLERFEQEAVTIAALEHFAIVPVYDFGEEDDAPYLVMRYMSGGSLRDTMGHEPLSLRETSQILQRLAPALDKAHERGIIHRDLKPDNVLFDEDALPYLADFGIARMAEATHTMTIVGTPGYMSPEQAQGKQKLDWRSDIYALGVMLFEMLSGRQPYVAETPTGQMLMHILEPVPDVLSANPDLPPQAQLIIDKVMAKDREQRYQTAAALAEAVNQLLIIAEVPDEAPAPQIMPVPSVLEESADVFQQPVPSLPTADRVETVVETPAEGFSAKSMPILPDKDDNKNPVAVPPSAESEEPRKKTRLPAWAWWVGAIVVVLLLIFGIRPLFFPENDGPTVAEEAPTEEAAIEVVAPTEDAIVAETKVEEAAPTVAVPSTEPATEVVPTADIPEVGWAVMPGGFMESALQGEFAGTEVTYDGVMGDYDRDRLEESVAPFEAATGIKINYIGDGEFESRIREAVNGGYPPDIADFPQPGLLGEFARQGHIVDPTSWMSNEWLQQQYNQSWLDMAMVDGPDGQPMMGGTWHRFNAKSLVWYPKAQFEAAGYAVPETWDELMTLTQLIADDGDPAWCIGIESGAATGWVATDWTEEMMLRTTSLENYDAWVDGRLPFDSPEVRRAIAAWSEIWFNDRFVLGGTDAIATTFFGESPVAMFDNPPGCWMHKQGSFIPAFFPEGVKRGTDWDFFYLPAIGDEYGKPFLIAGDLNGMFNDRPEVRAVMEYMTTPQSVKGWLEQGGALAAHQTVTPDMYSQDVERGIAALVDNGTSFRFDGSDLMPGEVGAGSFWVGMTDYVNGSAALDSVLTAIDASWPR